ncbi:MAG: Fe-S cluster assembly protein NifU [Anaerolineaceae bacterium]|nr:Fe-S cluster assembly protein NifU [Anaerolineaceae bacterium]
MWDYSEKVKEHFLHPRNVGQIDNPDAVAEVGNITCGDALKLMLKIDDRQRIVDAKFQTFGCASAIASSSALTEMIKGMTVEEASKLTNDDIADFLEGLPEAKMHCSVMGMEALQKAIAAYRGEKFELETEGRIVCRCFGVTDKLIEKVVRDHDLTTIEEVTHYCKAGGGCGGCHEEIQEIIDRITGPKAAVATAVKTAGPKRSLTNIEKMRLITETIEREIRPILRADGGDIELVDIDRDKVTVALRGRCSDCRVSQFTLKDVVQQKLREHVADSIVVHQDNS